MKQRFYLYLLSLLILVNQNLPLCKALPENTLSPNSYLFSKFYTVSLTLTGFKKEVISLLVTFIKKNQNQINNKGVLSFFNYALKTKAELFSAWETKEEKKYYLYLTMYSLGIYPSLFIKNLHQVAPELIHIDFEGFTEKAIKKLHDNLYHLYLKVQKSSQPQDQHQIPYIIEYFQTGFNNYLKDNKIKLPHESPYYQDFFEVIIYPEKRLFLGNGELKYCQKLQTLTEYELNMEWERLRKEYNNSLADKNRSFLHKLTVSEFIHDVRQYSHYSSLKSYEYYIDMDYLDKFISNLFYITFFKNILIEWISRYWFLDKENNIIYNKSQVDKSSSIILKYLTKKENKEITKKMLPELDKLILKQIEKIATKKSNRKNRSKKIRQSS